MFHWVYRSLLTMAGAALASASLAQSPSECGAKVRSCIAACSAIGTAGSVLLGTDARAKIRDCRAKCETERQGCVAARGSATPAPDPAPSAAPLPPAQLSASPAAAASGPRSAVAVNPHLDVVGIRVGMTVEQAAAALRAHNPAMQFKLFGERPGELGPLAPRVVHGAARNPGNEFAEEIIEFEAQPGPMPPVVTAIVRRVVFRGETAPTIDNAVKGLTQKYGDHVLRGRPGGFSHYYWHFDAAGTPQPRASPCSKVADGLTRGSMDRGVWGDTPLASHARGPLEAAAKDCGRYVSASIITIGDKPTVTSLIVVAADEQLRFDRFLVINAEYEALVAAQKREQQQRANDRGVPKL